MFIMHSCEAFNVEETCEFYPDCVFFLFQEYQLRPSEGNLV